MEPTARTIALMACLLLTSCDNEEVTIPLDGYAPYKEKVTRDVCAEWPKELVYASHGRPQVEIIRNKCLELGYPLSIRPSKDFTPDCDLGGKMPKGYNTCVSMDQ